MQKIKRFKIAIALILILSMAMIYGSVPNVEADSLDWAKDTISDSSPGQEEVTHTIEYDLGTALTAGQYVRFTFEAGIDLSAATTTCPLNTTASATAQLIDCVVDAGQTLASTTATSTIITDAANPSTTGDYSVTISTHETDDVEIESSEVKIYIIDEVTVTAHVEATLSFAIGTTTPDDLIGAENFTGTSSPTSLAFGTLDGVSLMGHLLSVSTNADDGYTVTVQQDENLQTAAGSDIDSFSTSSSAIWSLGTPDIDDEDTWGYMGLTSDDSDVSATSSKYQGLDGTNAFTIMTHNGPTNGTGVGVGTTTVGYKIEVSALQEAGDYQNALTYICTPTY